MLASIPSPTVLIIGAGIGGLVLAHGLQKHHIPFQIFERDADANFRPQGYRIRVAREGAEALRLLLDDDTWDLFEQTCGTTRLKPISEIDAETARIDFAGIGGAISRTKMPGNVYTVDRTVFRQVLLRNLSTKVEYSKKLKMYETTATGVDATFEDSDVRHGTLIVGADGAHSVVRKQRIPDLEILDTHGRCLYGKTELNLGALRDILPAIAQGGIQITKDRTQTPFPAMVTEPVIFSREDIDTSGIDLPPDYLYWVLTIRSELLELSEYGGKNYLSASEAGHLALKVSERWHPSLRAIILNQLPGYTSLLPIRSVGSHIAPWEADANATLLGDAVHLMGPTSGSGAITAIRDAATLTQLLAEKGQSRETIAAYEEKMRAYAGETVGRSWRNATAMFEQTKENDENVASVMMANREKK